MEQTLRVLLVEDNPNDAALIVGQLRREGFEPDWHRVDCEADYLAHLNDSLDVVLSDYALPSFDIARALRLLQERHLDVPFIVISGTIGEERAVEVLKLGATDYLLKDRLQRLGGAITRAMQSRALRREHQRAQHSLRDSEQRYRLMFEHNPQPMWVFDTDTYRFLAVNDAAVHRYGYSREEFLGMSVFDIRPAGIVQPASSLSCPVERYDQLGAFTHLKRDGSLMVVEVSSHELIFSDRPARAVLAQDVTERRRAEEALLKNQQRTQFALSAGGTGIWDWDATTAELTGPRRSRYSRPGAGQLRRDLWRRSSTDSSGGPGRRARRDRHGDGRAPTMPSSSTERVWPDGTDAGSRNGRSSRRRVRQGVRAVGIGVDVTERRELEDQLAAGAEDGGGRPARRRHRARLQQPADRRSSATPSSLVRWRCPTTIRSASDVEEIRKRRRPAPRPDAAAARVQPPAGAAAARRST